MRKLLVASTVGALTGVAMLASAAGPDASEGAGARAYLSYAFGGNAAQLPRNFHYGLRLDAGSRSDDGAARPALMQVDFDRSGLRTAHLNGMSVVQRLRLNQDEAAPAEEPAPPIEDSAPVEEESSTGSGEPVTTYSVVDWTLIAVGVVGIGYAAAEALDAEESDEPPPASTGGGTTGGGLLAGLPGGLLGFTPNAAQSVEDRERQAWLDGGSGQMGDLASE